ncbi:MAG: lytic transglycosylase domain-containing protein [Flavisolibacter sp.]
MLKKNLVRTGFLSQGLLFMMPNAGSVKGNESHSLMETSNVSMPYKKRSTVDTLIVLPSDSLGYTFSRELTEEELLAAPQISLNKNVSRYVKDFMKREKEFLVKMESRSQNHFDFMDSVFMHYGLPVELKYLAIVESQLNTKAVSKVGAKGLWQFMPATARELGLKVTKYNDERVHANKSTVAAARYLKRLHNMFGDWLLVLAAYNGGPGTVFKAIKNSGSRNFWALQNHLPAETRGHVKRFIGVHYYFEGAGSITTQTKAEAISHKKAMDKYKTALRERVVDTITVAVAGPM